MMNLRRVMSPAQLFLIVILLLLFFIVLLMSMCSLEILLCSIYPDCAYNWIWLPFHAIQIRKGNKFLPKGYLSGTGFSHRQVGFVTCSGWLHLTGIRRGSPMDRERKLCSSSWPTCCCRCMLVLIQWKPCLWLPNYLSRLEWPSVRAWISPFVCKGWISDGIQVMKPNFLFALHQNLLTQQIAREWFVDMLQIS